MRQRVCLSFASLLKISIDTAHLLDGQILHFLITEQQLDTLSFLGAHLIRFYSACGLLPDASLCFIRVPEPSAFAWSAIIFAHVKHGNPCDALALYNHILLSCAHLLDAHVMVAVLTACTALSSLPLGTLLHVQSLALGFMAVDIVCNTLLNMYVKCGSMAHAAELFDRLLHRDGVTWNTMILACADHGYEESALCLFANMVKDDIEPDQATFIAILRASIYTDSTQEGSLIHGLITEFGMETLVNIATSLLDMYARMGSLEDAQNVFFHLPQKSIVTWTAMAAAYTHNNRSEEALQTFQQMQQESIWPDRVTLISILQACSSIVGLHQGKAIHTYILDQGIPLDAVIGSALIDMYFKCGSIEGAAMVFSEMPRQSVVIWNTMISGCAQLSSYNLAMGFFEAMQGEGLEPDRTTFVSLLSACSHAGSIEIGCHHFKAMREEYGVVPTLDHYMCMVDLLGRAGSVHEAEALLQTMPNRPSEVGWRSLLGHCRTWGKVDLARACFDYLSSIDASEPTMYALMLEVYADANMREEWEKLDKARNAAAVWKAPGVAFVDIGEKIHGFTVGDRSFYNGEFSGKLDALNEKLRKVGYVPLYAASVESEEREEKAVGCFLV